jgi:hypothetical protein
LKNLTRDLVVAFVAGLVVLLTSGQSPWDAAQALAMAFVYGGISALDTRYARYGVRVR